MIREIILHERRIAFTLPLCHPRDRSEESFWRFDWQRALEFEAISTIVIAGCMMKSARKNRKRWKTRADLGG